MSNPLNNFLSNPIRNFEDILITKSNNTSQTNPSTMNHSSEVANLSIDTSSVTANYASQGIPNSTASVPTPNLENGEYSEDHNSVKSESPPSKVSKLKSFFKRRQSMPHNSQSSTADTPPNDAPTSPVMKIHNNRLSLKVTFKESPNQSSIPPISTLNSNPYQEPLQNQSSPSSIGSPNNVSPSLLRKTSNETLPTTSQISSFAENKEKEARLSNLSETPLLQSSIKLESTKNSPHIEEVLRNPTMSILTNDEPMMNNTTKKSTSPITSLLSDRGVIISNNNSHDNIDHSKLEDSSSTNRSKSNTTSDTLHVTAMAMDKLSSEVVSHNSISANVLADSLPDNIVNTKQVGANNNSMRMNTTPPVVIKKVVTKQSFETVVEDFLTKSVSSPTQDETTPNRNATALEVVEEEESSEEESSEDEETEEETEEESNEDEEEGSSQHEDTEQAKANTSSFNQSILSGVSQTNIDDPLSVKTMISPQDLQTISYEVNEKLNESVQKEFDLSKEEQVLDSFLCAYYESKMPQQGKMYITQNYVCFSSNIFGYKICLVIAFSDVKSIQKKMTAMFIPNAIEIFLKDGSSHFFGSFVFRDNVYKVLLALYSLHAKARGNILISLRSANNVLHSVDNNEKPPGFTDSSYITEEEEGESEEEEEGESDTEEESGEEEEEPVVANGVKSVPVETMAKNPEAVNPTQSSNKSPESSKTNRNGSGDEQNNANNHNNSNNEEKKANENSENNGNNNPNNNPNNTSNNDNNEEKEEEEEDEEYQLPEEDEKITNISDLPGSDFFADPEKFKPKEIATEVLPVSMLDAWFLLKSDNINFQNEHHKSREETTVQYSSYVKLAGSPGLMRKVTFVSKVNNSLGPKSTRIECVERAVLCKGKRRIINQTSMTSLDVPFSDTFKIQNYWVFDDIDGKSCSVKIYSGVYFLKSSLLRWKIEDAGDKESKQALTIWIGQAKEAIGQAKASGNLQSLKKTGKPKKRKTSTTKETKKKSSRKKAVETKPTVTNVTFAETNPFATSQSAPPVELDTLTKTLNFVMGIPGYLTANISLPVWLFLVIIFAMVFLLFSQQYTILQTMKQVEYNVQTYKQQTVLFEQELNHLVFNLAQLNTTSLTENNQALQNQLSNWLTTRNELYKSHIDNDLLHSLLYELAEIKKMMNKKDNG